MTIHEEADLPSPHAVPVSARTPKAAPEVSRSTESAAPVPASSHAAAFALQRLAGNSAVSGLFAQRDAAGEEEGGAGRSPVLDVVGKGGGSALDVTLRREMEASLGADFSNVRLHTDATASESARAVNANAYTVNNDVVIRADRFSPGTAEGRRTIAHELTHVVQQRNGPVAGRDTGSGIRLSDPADDFEQAAEQTASAVVAAGSSAQSRAGAAGTGAQLEREDEAVQGEFVQRAAEEEEVEDEAVQGEFVQRAAEEEEVEDDEKVPGGA